MRIRIGFDDIQGEGKTIFTGIARVEKLAWAMYECRGSHG